MNRPANPAVEGAADVERQLAELWRAASTAEQAVLRACMMNLVIYCEDGADPAAIAGDVARLSEQLPGRALVLCPEPGEGDALDISVNAHCHQRPDGKQVCSEQISLRTRGKGRELIPGTLRGLLVGDCPVYTWWRRSRMAADPLFDPLVEMSDRFVVDTREVADPAAYLGALSRAGSGHARAIVGDLTWVRGEAWRDLVASMFDPATTRPLLDSLTAVEVTSGGTAPGEGVTVAAAYLAGWIAARLGWRPPAEAGGPWRRPGAEVRIACRQDRSAAPGEIVAVRLVAERDGRRALFEAHRAGGAPELVRLAVELEGACALPWVRRIEKLSDLALFCGYLQRRERDSVFLGALEAAARIAGPRR